MLRLTSDHDQIAGGADDFGLLPAPLRPRGGDADQQEARRDQETSPETAAGATARQTLQRDQTAQALPGPAAGQPGEQGQVGEHRQRGQQHESLRIG
jgi:hypothetical protein